MIDRSIPDILSGLGLLSLLIYELVYNGCISICLEYNIDPVSFIVYRCCCAKLKKREGKIMFRNLFVRVTCSILTNLVNLTKLTGLVKKSIF